MTDTKPPNPVEPFKKALGEATRAMANEPELNVAYSVDPPGVANDTLRLPQISRRMTRAEVMLARGEADAQALRLRFHSDSTHMRYTPRGETARTRPGPETLSVFTTTAQSRSATPLPRATSIPSPAFRASHRKCSGAYAPPTHSKAKRC